MALDAGGDAGATVVGFDAKNAAVTADIHVTGKRDLLGKRKHELDGGASLHGGVSHEIETAIAYVAGSAVFLDHLGAVGVAHPDREHHRKSTGGPALHTVLNGSGHVGPSYHRLPHGATGFNRGYTEANFA